MMEEISLRELIEILIKRKRMIAIITVVAVLVATIFSFVILKPTYEASMILIASNATENIQNNGNISDVEDMLNTMSKYPTMNMETYRQQITTPEVMDKTIKDLGLEEEYSISSLSNDITLETIKDTQLIKIKMVDTDPEKAALIVNKLGKNFIDFVSENVKARSTTTSAHLSAQMEIEKQYYDEALLEQKEVLSQPRGASEVGLELNAKLDQITRYKTQINDLAIRKDGLISAIATAEKEPKKGSGIIINRSLGDNIVIDDSEKTLKIELADVNGSIDSTTEKIAELQNNIEKLQIEFQEKIHKESIMNQKVNLAQKTYEAFVKKYEELRVKESSKIGEASITVISKAYPSTTPVGPRKALNLAISLVLGLMIGVFAAFFTEYWQSTDDKIKKLPN